jgi:hypothetical protein
MTPSPYLLEALVGICVGALTGMLLTLVWRRQAIILLDALLGATGFIGGVYAMEHIPWTPTTVSQRVGDAIVTTTRFHYQHPYRIGLVLAVVLPLIFEMIRFAVLPRFRKQ